jgi:hypothetical protein
MLERWSGLKNIAREIRSCLWVWQGQAKGKGAGRRNPPR